MRKIDQPIITCFTNKHNTYVDKYGANVVIEYAHSKNHDGDFYFHSDSFTLAGSDIANYVLAVGV